MFPLKSALSITFFASAALAASGTLDNTPRAVLWSGTVEGGSGPLSEVPECAPGCQRFDLTLSLPPGVWNNKPGGVQVAIRFGGAAFDNLRLYVYRGTSLIAKSDGIIATAQSVLLREAANGELKIYVVYDSDSPNPSVAYEGLAEVEYDPQPHPARQLLPDLFVRSQRNLSFEPFPSLFGDSASATYPTCYESEVQEEGARLCLRFDQILANTGEGPLDLRFSAPAGTTPATTNAYQRIYGSSGAPTDYQDQLVGQMELHPVHSHYHFRSFGQTSLWKVDTSGPHLIRSGRKVSFCLADTLLDAWGEKGDGPRFYIAPDCLLPAYTSGGVDYFFQGISRGWADVYDWYLPDQYIDVSGVADGVYVLQTVADPDNSLVEADDSNNCGNVTIRLSNMNTPTPSAQIVGPGRGCLK
jgi:hypothetical protein